MLVCIHARVQKFNPESLLKFHYIHYPNKIEQYIRNLDRNCGIHKECEDNLLLNLHYQYT